VTAEQRRATRVEHGIPDDALVVIQIGSINHHKANVEAIQASAQAGLENAVFVFAGLEFDRGAARREAERCGLNALFLGPVRDINEVCSMADIGISLRRPPSNGETSAALFDLLGAGVPTIVSDVGSMSDLPSDAVAKVPWEASISGVAEALRRLAANPSLRRLVGANAQRYLRECHSWERAGSQMAEALGLALRNVAP
jgi:glycosyltransferase involved in cell wall biosynthesis